MTPMRLDSTGVPVRQLTALAPPDHPPRPGQRQLPPPPTERRRFWQPRLGPALSSRPRRHGRSGSRDVRHRHDVPRRLRERSCTGNHLCTDVSERFLWTGFRNVPATCSAAAVRLRGGAFHFQGCGTPTTKDMTSKIESAGQEGPWSHWLAIRERVSAVPVDEPPALQRRVRRRLAGQSPGITLSPHKSARHHAA